MKGEKQDKRAGAGNKDYQSYGPSTALQAGTAAPDFTLHTTPDQTVSLTDFRGRPVILMFYPADWSPVCGDQVVLYNELLPEFQRHDEAALLGISVDGVWCHLAFARDRKLKFPLMADFEPKGAVARTYGVYRQHDGVCERAPVRPRRRGNHPLELRVPDRRQPRRRRHSVGARSPHPPRGNHMTRKVATARLAVPVGDQDHVQGPATAPVTMVEYGDFECPFCGQAHRVVKALKKALGRRLRFVFRHFPLATAHPRAQQAAEAAEAAGRKASSGKCTTCCSTTRKRSKTTT